MAKSLSTLAQNQLNRNDILHGFEIQINGIKCNDVLSYSIDNNRDFGCATLQVVINNDSGKYSLSGASEIKLRDTIQLVEKISGATDTFNSFKGYVTQRNIDKSADANNINLTCLDYIIKLQETDINESYEATKYSVVSETLTPNYLPSPNDMFASIFDFANTNLANDPPISLRIKNKTTALEDPQWNGFEVQYSTGQVTLGAVLNARDNYDVIATYYFYPKGLYIEDIIESILTEKDGYCYSDDTEVLTENGWKLIKYIVEGKEKIKIATLNHEKNIVEYHYPLDYIKQKYSGKVLHQKGKRIDFKVTPNHNVWGNTNKNKYKFYKAKNIPNGIRYRKDFPYNDKNKEKEYFILPRYELNIKHKGYINYKGNKIKDYKRTRIFNNRKIKMDDWLKLFGIWIAEGCSSTCRIIISQKNIEKKKIIEKYIKSLGYNPCYCDGNSSFTFTDTQLAHYLQQFGYCYDKFIPIEFLNLSKRQLNILLDALMLGDGSGKCYYTSSKKLADNVQEIMLKLGFTPNVTTLKHRNKNTLYIIEKSNRKITKPNSYKHNNNWVDYNNFVYCLNVPNHLLYIRRNGKGCWCGNSNYLFGESSSDNVVTNHLTETFLNIEAKAFDTLTPNTASETIDIETTLTVACAVGATSITVTDASGFPTTVGTHTFSVNGDTASYTTIVGNVISGIPATGAYALRAHPIGSYVVYTAIFPVNQLWYLSYDNLITDLSGNVASYISNADIDDEDMAVITDWIDDDIPSGDSSQATFDGKSCMKLDSVEGQAARRQDIGSFDSRTVFSMNLYHDALGTLAQSDYFFLYIYDGYTALRVFFASDGLFIYTGSSNVEVGTDLVALDVWQEWTFDVNWVAKTVDVYLDKVLKASNVDCSWASTSYSDGNVRFGQRGVTNINQITYIDWFKAGSTFGTVSDFTLPVGSTLRYFDKRYGRILLNSPVASNSTVTCETNYSFRTLQASGIEINGMKLKERNEASRFDALTKLRNLVPPNYVIRTIGDDKIWASYLNQKTTADFELQGIKSISYGEDQDLYTRTLFFGKNANPHNLMFDSGVAFLDSGETYTATTTNTELSYYADEGSFRLYTSGLQTGKILIDTIVPVVYINNIPIDNNVHEIIQTGVLISTRVQTTTTTRERTSDTPEITTNTYYNYKVYFSHRGIVPSQVVTLYSPVGTILYTLGPNDGNMDYENGIYHVPGSSANSTIEQCSTASYWVMYSTDDLQIDYSNAKFKISKRIVPVTSEALVTATFEYQTVSTPVENAAAALDGRWDTQTQTTFYAKPPRGFVYAVVDLGSIKSIQLLDIIAGWFRPDQDGRRKFDMTNRITLKYSLDNIIYYDISSETTDFELVSGKTKTFDEKVLGEDFEARYFKLIIEDMEKIDFGELGCYAISLVEVAAYQDVVLRGECKLVPTTQLTQSYSGGATMYVSNTSHFPSGAGFAYLNSGSGLSTSSFWYSSKASNSFGGVTGSGLGLYNVGNLIYNNIEDDTSLYDSEDLLSKLGDLVYKNTNVNEYLISQEKVNTRAKDYLREFQKEHTLLDVSLIYAPYLQIGNTVALTDMYNHVENICYFIERKSTTQAGTDVTLARYP